MSKRDEDGATFVEKAHIVSKNIDKLTRMAEKLSPRAVRRDVIAKIVEVIEEVVVSRTPSQRFRAMEKLEEHAEHEWMVRLAVIAYAAKLLDIESVAEIDGRRGLVDKLQEEINEDSEKGSPGDDGVAGAED